MALILPGNVASATAAGYEVANSCRLDGPSAYLRRTNGNETTTKITFSVWVKRGVLGSTQRIFAADGNDYMFFRFESTNAFRFNINIYGVAESTITTNRLFRDVSAWYHLVVTWDSTQSTAADRIKLWVNGTQETSFSASTYPAEDQTTTAINNTAANAFNIGRYETGDNEHFNGYIAEVVIATSQALAPTDFGEFDEDSPTIWKPKDVSGLTFGDNGFYLDFEASDNLGNDANGGTDFTETNLAATDQATDTPTNNFATLNSLDTNGNHTLSEGNLKAVYSAAAGTFGVTKGTVGVSAGKWYWEIKYTYGNAGQFGVFDVNDLDTLNTTDIYNDTSTFEGLAWRIDTSNNIKEVGTNQTADSGMDFATGDILGIAFDADNGKFYGFKNGAEITGQDIDAGTSLLTAVTVSDFYLPFISNGDGGSGTKTGTSEMNFGNPPYANSSSVADANGYGAFEYAPPSGYLALCTKNLGSTGG